jgi:hypothetical protein
MFIEALEDCFLTVDSEEPKAMLEWFSSLGNKSSKPFAKLIQPLVIAHYAGEYSQQEYSLLSQMGDLDNSERWESMWQYIEERWADIDLLLGTTSELVRLLIESDVPEVDWYTQKGTLQDLQALEEALALAKRRGAEKVVIQFS